MDEEKIPPRLRQDYWVELDKKGGGLLRSTLDAKVANERFRLIQSQFKRNYESMKAQVLLDYSGDGTDNIVDDYMIALFQFAHALYCLRDIMTAFEKLGKICLDFYRVASEPAKYWDKGFNSLMYVSILEPHFPTETGLQLFGLAQEVLKLDPAERSQILSKEDLAMEQHTKWTDSTNYFDSALLHEPTIVVDDFYNHLLLEQPNNNNIKFNWILLFLEQIMLQAECDSLRSAYFDPFPRFVDRDRASGTTGADDDARTSSLLLLQLVASLRQLKKEAKFFIRSTSAHLDYTYLVGYKDSTVFEHVQLFSKMRYQLVEGLISDLDFCHQYFARLSEPVNMAFKLLIKELDTNEFRDIRYGDDM